jgi:hypothetical protein
MGQQLFQQEEEKYKATDEIFQVVMDLNLIKMV